jgi:hypothetical protein
MYSKSKAEVLVLVCVGGVTLPWQKRLAWSGWTGPGNEVDVEYHHYARRPAMPRQQILCARVGGKAIDSAAVVATIDFDLLLILC